MATGDDTDLSSLLGSLAQYGVGTAGTLGANAAQQQAYQAIIQNLDNRFNDYSSLAPAGYKPITAQTLGPSALTGIQNDAQARTQEESAISQLQDLANRGGLNLSDMAALDQVQANLNKNTQARNQSTANQFADRGELGSGSQLAMDLANNQNATQSANQTGQNTAAQAQTRAMQAVLQDAQASRTMSQDDLAKKTAAAQATDSINKYNASMQTDASKYNNSLQGQTYDDTLKKLQGENTVTGQLDSALLGSGQQQAGTIAGLSYGANGLLNGLSKGLNGSKNNNGTPPPPGSDPSEWEQYPGETPPPDSNSYGGTKLTDTTDSGSAVGDYGTGFEDDLLTDVA